MGVEARSGFVASMACSFVNGIFSSNRECVAVLPFFSFFAACFYFVSLSPLLLFFFSFSSGSESVSCMCLLERGGPDVTGQVW